MCDVWLWCVCSEQQLKQGGHLSSEVDVDSLMSYVLKLRSQYRMALLSSAASTRRGNNDTENKQLNQLSE